MKNKSSYFSLVENIRNKNKHLSFHILFNNTNFRISKIYLKSYATCNWVDVVIDM